MFGFLGLKPITKNCWSKTTKKIKKEAKNLLKNDLNRAAFVVKEYNFALGEADCTREQLSYVVVNAGVTINASGALEDGQLWMLSLLSFLSTLERLLMFYA